MHNPFPEPGETVPGVAPASIAMPQLPERQVDEQVFHGLGVVVTLSANQVPVSAES